MKLTNAIKKLEKAGWDIIGEKGVYTAIKSGSSISFSAQGSDECSRFTYDSDLSCAPTFGMTLKAAMGNI
jgi:hypothetical protein